MRAKWLISVGIISYLLALAWAIPARLGVDYALSQLDKSAKVAMYNAAGRIWNGNADVAVAGRELGTVSWNLHPLSLLLGRVAADVEIDNSEGHVEGIVAVGLGGTVSLSEVDGSVPVSQLQGFLPLKGMPVAAEGLIVLRMDTVELEEGMPSAAEGVLSWQQAGLSAPQRLELGDLHMTVSTDAEGIIKGVVEDAGGALKADGELTLDQEQNYRVDLSLGARDSGQEDLVHALAMLGPADQQGMTSVSLKGRL